MRSCEPPYKPRSALYTKCRSPNDPQGNAPLGDAYSGANGTFIHPLYGAVTLHGGGPRTSLTGVVHVLGSPAEPCRLGVWLRTTLMAIHHLGFNTLPATQFSYTCYMDLYSQLAASRSVSHRQSTHYRKSCSALYTRCMTRNNRLGNATLDSEH